MLFSNLLVFRTVTTVAYQTPSDLTPRKVCKAYLVSDAPVHGANQAREIPMSELYKGHCAWIEEDIKARELVGRRRRAT